MKKLVKEFSYWLRFRKIPPEKLRIVFFHENHQYYSYLEGLVKALTESHGETVYYITTSAEDPILNDPPPGVIPFYFNNLLVLVLGSINCRVMVMTLTDLNHFYVKRSVQPVHYVYAYHSLVSTHMIYRYGAFDHYDSILCVGPHHIKEINAHEAAYGVKKKQLVEAGYYRLERVYEEFKDTPFATEDPGNTILIAPSWGKENILETIGIELVGLLIEKGYNVIVRPHPEAVKRTPEVVDRIENHFADHDSLTIERSVATNDSFFKSDVLISDYSGVTLEYALGTDRPVLYIDVPKKINNDRYTELNLPVLEVDARTDLGIVIPPDNVDQIPDAIEKLKSERARFRENIARIREDYVFNFGRSSEAGAAHIIDILNQDA